MVAAETDAQGKFRVSAFDRTRYRIHAVTQSANIDQAVSAEPLPLDPQKELAAPIRLVLTNSGHSVFEMIRKANQR